jgi:hypothetical protein
MVHNFAFMFTLIIRGVAIEELHQNKLQLHQLGGVGPLHQGDQQLGCMAASFGAMPNMSWIVCFLCLNFFSNKPPWSDSCLLLRFSHDWSRSGFESAPKVARIQQSATRVCIRCRASAVDVVSSIFLYEFSSNFLVQFGGCITLWARQCAHRLRLLFCQTEFQIERSIILMLIVWYQNDPLQYRKIKYYICSFLFITD